MEEEREKPRKSEKKFKKQKIEKNHTTERVHLSTRFAEKPARPDFFWRWNRDRGMSEELIFVRKGTSDNFFSERCDSGTRRA